MPPTLVPRATKVSKSDKVRVLVIDDDTALLESLCELLEAWGMAPAAAAAATEAAERLERNTYDVALLDIMMPGIDGITFLSQLRSQFPDLPVIMITGQPSIERAITSMREGAVDFLIKPVEADDLRFSIHRALKLHDQFRIGKLAPQPALIQLVGVSESIRNIEVQIAQLITANCNSILILGETGTGKEVVARLLHAQGGSTPASFVAVSCPSVSDQLVESEFFGHVKGSFTGAETKREGLLSQSGGGTLFLDEIADLSPHAQATLLRVLESRKFRPVGGDRESDFSARIVAATNVPLEDLVARASFRSDLYYRLAVHQIALAPLRDRAEDILPLAYHFLTQCRSVRIVTATDFDEGARAALLAHHYPGNTRELRNVIERAAVVSTGELIEARHLQIWSPARESIDLRANRFENSGEAYRLLDALEQTKWNRRKASELLHMPYSTLRYKLKILGID
jgi:DNA-binding NtrC family response regulator